MQDFDIACVGNAKIDLFLHFDDANKHLKLNEQSNELYFHLGEKIAVDKCRLSPGGNAANVAAGLSRLEINTTLFAEIGDDELSDKIINSLKKEKVHTENVSRLKDHTASVSVILSFKGDRTIFSQHIQKPHDFKFDNLSTKWVYLTSIGEEWKNAYEKVIMYVTKTNCRLAFNPGTVQINAGYESIANVLNATNILFVNKEEAAKIKNYELRIMNQEDNEKKIKLLLEQLQKLGPKIVVITDGENGSFAIDEKGQIHTNGIIKTNIAEKTGAGDAYSSGFMAAMSQGKSIKDAMLWGTISSANVIEKV